MTNTNVVFPSIRQTTLASSTSKLSSQTVPQFPRNQTTTLPEFPSPPFNRIPKNRWKHKC